MEPPRQNELLRSIGTQLLDHVPEEWREIRLAYHAVRKHKAASVEVRKADGSEEEVGITAAIYLDLEKLREGMYRKGKGTWFLLKYTIVSPGRFSVDFDYESEPDFFGVPSNGGDFLDDLRHFPRDDENIPAWLAQKISGN